MEGMQKLTTYLNKFVQTQGNLQPTCDNCGDEQEDVIPAL